jgi:hypothetical protein
LTGGAIISPAQAIGGEANPMGGEGRKKEEAAESKKKEGMRRMGKPGN